MTRTSVRRLVLLVILALTLISGCAVLQEITGVRTGMGQLTLPDPSWPITSQSVADGVSTLKWGYVRLGSARAILEQAVADNRCDASAHYYLSLAYTMSIKKSWDDWMAHQERQAMQTRNVIIGPLATLYPNTVARFYTQLFESQMGQVLQPLRERQSALMTRAAQLRRGEVAGCAR